MRYTLIEDKEGAIEIIDVSRPSANVKIRTMIEDGGMVVGYIDSELSRLRLCSGLEKHERQRAEDALNRLDRIKEFVHEI